MPIWKTVARYYDDQSKMGWSHTNWRPNSDTSANDVMVAWNDWNDAYMELCAETVHPLDLRVYNDDELYAVAVFDRSFFTTTEGQKPGLPTEISSYVKLTGYNYTVLEGQSSWKLHGITEDAVDGSVLNPDYAGLGLLTLAANDWFRAYRPEAGEKVPPIIAPLTFDQFLVSGMYGRRTGRSFLSPGQQRRYTRTPSSP